MDNITRKARCRTCSLCLSWGGIVLGNAGEMTAAKRRLAEIASTWPCKTGFYLPRPCLRVSAFNRTRVDSLTLGKVSAEQPACDRDPAPYYCTARPVSGSTYAASAWETSACPCSAEFHKERHPGYGMIRFWRCYKNLVARLLPGVHVNQRNIEADLLARQRRSVKWRKVLSTRLSIGA